MRIQLASFDTFHVPALQRALSEDYQTHYISTWSPKRQGPNPDLPRRNIWPMHYALQIYRMYPWLQFRNETYSLFVAAFDTLLCSSLKPTNFDAYIPLSGISLWSGRKIQKAGRPVILECGSTHTDHQHEVVSAEFRRNGINYPLFPKSYRDRVRQEFQEADFIFLPSRFVANTFVERGIPKEKIYLNQYGTDTSLFKPGEDSATERPFRVICPSGVNLRKGARVLVEAWKKLCWTDAELHWIGSPEPMTRHLFTPMPHGIVWHGWMYQNQLAELYASCDVMVLPSFEEGFARVMIEAAASGLPVIATPESGVEDFFTPDAPEGWLISANSVDALCEALITAKRDRDATRKLGKRAAERAREGFGKVDYAERARANFKEALYRFNGKSMLSSRE